LGSGGNDTNETDETDDDWPHWLAIIDKAETEGEILDALEVRRRANRTFFLFFAFVAAVPPDRA
jgi:DNA-directed RNA polymerase subunit N (RpoN/RPB10)